MEWAQNTTIGLSIGAPELGIGVTSHQIRTDYVERYQI